MYKISVPLMNSIIKRSNRKKVVEELKKLDAERVFLALDSYELDENKQKEIFKELADNCKFFKEQGFEVGSWNWTFWVHNNKTFTSMRSIKGTDIKEFACPTDESFVEFACNYIKSIASCDVDMIMFDDDFRYGFLAESPACLCDNHVKMINEITSSSLTREEIVQHIENGDRSIYRSAYLKANGDAFRSFAKRLRQALNEVNPKIRMGACACMTSWDIDGTDAFELATILAGDTKPFVRQIGAPYWAVNKNWGNMLQDVIELERMESVWTKRGEIEIMAEGDVYPRPRTNCPAAFLEGFDTAIRVSECTDGILKYGIDYYSNAHYETGYRKFHERNLEIYKKIDEFFSKKTHIGIRIYESMKKTEAMKMPTKVNDSVTIENLFFSKASRCLAFNTIPTVFEGSGVTGMVFDENARNFCEEAFKNGLILDLAAAEILTERGFDVGIKKINDAIKQSDDCSISLSEHFLNNNNYVSVSGCTLYDIELSKNAEILSDMEFSGKLVPLSYRYENEKGQRFLVFNVNTRLNSDNYLKSYERGRQIADSVFWLSGQKLPAYAYGNPALYTQAKADENSLSVGLWNFYADIAINPVIELDKKYSSVRFINCDGTLDGDKLYLSDIPPYAFVGFEVR